MRLRVRDAAPADAAATAALLTELGYPASSEFAAERLTHFAADRFSRVQVAELNGAEVIGLLRRTLFLDSTARSRHAGSWTSS
jgi:hypothetical protein